MKHIVLTDWSDFEEGLRTELGVLRHEGHVIARNFSVTSVTADFVETDRLALVLSTGTDRDISSSFWNEPSFDHDHEASPHNNQPQDIVYAFTLDLSTTPYLVRHDEEPTSFDITDSLSQYDGIVVYHPRALRRVSKNEYWFNGSPLDAALLVFTVRDSDSED